MQLADGSKQRFGITRAHLEEDAGKTVYGGADRLAGSEYSLVDYNRAGVPLLEIVSEPDMRTGKDVYAYGSELRRLVRFLGISDGNMAEGSMRCDVNISVRGAADGLLLSPKSELCAFAPGDSSVCTLSPS